MLKVVRKRGKSCVYTALDLKDSKKVIIKEGIAYGEMENSGFDGKDRVIWEKCILNKLSVLSFLPKVKDFFYIRQDFFLVQEMVEGISLREGLLGGAVFSEKRVFYILVEILSNILWIHKAGFIIRDLSLDNIMYCSITNTISFIDVEYYHEKDSAFPPYYKVSSPGFSFENLNDEFSDFYSFFSIWYYLNNAEDYKKLVLSGEGEVKKFSDIESFLDNNLDDYLNGSVNIENVLCKLKKFAL